MKLDYSGYTLEELLAMDLKDHLWPEQREILKQIKIKRKLNEVKKILPFETKPVIVNEKKEEIKEILTKNSELKNASEYFNSKEIINIFSEIKPTNVKFIIVSYYTDEKYKNELQNLMESIRKFELSYYIEELVDKNNWVHNTHYKPSVIKRAMSLFNLPIVFIDADAVIRKFPELFENIKKDFAVFFSEGGNLLSGTLFFNNTAAAFSLVEDWEKQCKEETDTWDQHVLKGCVERKHIDIETLPKSYCQIFDSSKKETPVIEHYQASRRYKNKTKINEEKLILLVPSRKRPDNIDRFVRSVYSTASVSERVGIKFLISKTDLPNKNKIQELQCEFPNIFIQYESSPNKKNDIVNLSDLWNELYRENTWASYVGFYGDDVEFKTYGWDSMIMAEFLKNEEMPLMIRTNDNFQKEMAVLFFTNKQLHSVLGFYMPSQYKLVCMDQFLSEICQGAGCYKYLEHVNTYHHAVVLGRAESDETHEIRKKGSARKQVLEDMRLITTDEEVSKKKDLIDRLEKYIKFIKGSK